MEKTCPICGGGLQSGFVQAGQRVFWSKGEQRFLRMPKKRRGSFISVGTTYWKALPA